VGKTRRGAAGDSIAPSCARQDAPHRMLVLRAKGRACQAGSRRIIHCANPRTQEYQEPPQGHTSASASATELPRKHRPLSPRLRKHLALNIETPLPGERDGLSPSETLAWVSHRETLARGERDPCLDLFGQRMAVSLTAPTAPDSAVFPFAARQLAISGGSTHGAGDRMRGSLLKRRAPPIYGGRPQSAGVSASAGIVAESKYVLDASVSAAGRSGVGRCASAGRSRLLLYYSRA